MNQLLARILGANGGADRSNGLRKFEPTIVSGGGFFSLKGVVQDLSHRRMTMWLHEECSSVFPYGAPGQRTTLPSCTPNAWVPGLKCSTSPSRHHFGSRYTGGLANQGPAMVEAAGIEPVKLTLLFRGVVTFFGSQPLIILTFRTTIHWCSPVPRRVAVRRRGKFRDNGETVQCHREG
jgi:hypothetical protein